MAHKHDVKLSLLGPGIDVNVWDGYHATQDMFRVGSPWSYTLWHSLASESGSDEQSRRTAWTTLQTKAKLGDPVVLCIDNVAVASGLIEEIKPYHSREKGAGMVLSGRDLAANAVTWDADPKINLRNQTLTEALRQLFLPLQISGIVIGADADGDRQVRMGTRSGSRGGHTSRRRQNVDHYHPKIGEKIWELADRIVRRLGYLLWTAVSTDGSLLIVVDVPNYDSDVAFQFWHTLADGSDWEINPESNVLDAEFPQSIANIPTEVNIYGQNATGNAEDGHGKVSIGNTQLAAFQSDYSDNDVRRVVSPVTVARARHKYASRARTQDQLTQEGNRLIADAMRDFRLYACTTQGHGQFVSNSDNPTMYAFNTMAHVRDDLFSLNENMLIHRVEFIGGRSAGIGQITKTTLGTKNAIQLSPASD